jgi:hypothetical protein
LTAACGNNWPAQRIKQQRHAAAQFAARLVATRRDTVHIVGLQPRDA